MNDAQTIAVEVVAIQQVTPLIKHFKLLAPFVDALNTPIAASLVQKKKVLFGLH